MKATACREPALAEVPARADEPLLASWCLTGLRRHAGFCLSRAGTLQDVALGNTLPPANQLEVVQPRSPVSLRDVMPHDDPRQTILRERDRMIGVDAPVHEKCDHECCRFPTSSFPAS
jgi:hypothetical protein